MVLGHSSRILKGVLEGSGVFGCIWDALYPKKTSPLGGEPGHTDKDRTTLVSSEFTGCSISRKAFEIPILGMNL